MDDNMFTSRSDQQNNKADAKWNEMQKKREHLVIAV